MKEREKVTSCRDPPPLRPPRRTWLSQRLRGVCARRRRLHLKRRSLFNYWGRSKDRPADLWPLQRRPRPSRCHSPPATSSILLTLGRRPARAISQTSARCRGGSGLSPRSGYLNPAEFLCGVERLLLGDEFVFFFFLLVISTRCTFLEFYEVITTFFNKGIFQRRTQLVWVEMEPQI